MRQQTPHPPEQQFRRHRAFFRVLKIDRSILVVTKKEGKERRQKAALDSERKVKNEQIYGAKDLNEHGEAVRTFLFARHRICLFVSSARICRVLKTTCMKASLKMANNNGQKRRLLWQYD